VRGDTYVAQVETLASAALMLLAAVAGHNNGTGAVPHIRHQLAVRRLAQCS
jgi:hypothetical protein